MNTRRQFLAQAAALGAASITGQSIAAPGKKHTLCAFTKHLQGLSYQQIADIAAEVGLDGIEAPVRPGGHVEPEKVTEDLPKLIEALKKNNLEMTILTSGINQVSKEQNTEQVLRTAKALGVQRFRMLYFKYDLKRPIEAQLAEWKPLIKDLVQLCTEIGIQPLLQNHSGKDYFGAPIWDAWSLMKEYTPQQWGFAIDAYHTTVEAGLSWPIDTSLIGSHIQAIYFKDVKWVSPGKADGVPLGTGLVSKDMAKVLLQRGFSGPVSLHTEYMKGDAAKDPAFVKESLGAFKRDLAVMKEWLAM
ncbi:MAG: TIM barrel protein [Verrucomicrobiaceae bacterium]|nr:TIM barrel protein [Verrucomicrobiaceae bacterium]